MADLQSIADVLDNAATSARSIDQFSRATKLSVEEAYEVQSLSLKRRYDRGERRVGLKMGLTSREKMAQVGVHDVICGRLTDAMRIDEGGELRLGEFVHPRIEPEIAFILKSTVAGPVSAIEAVTAVEAVAPALDIIDSRYRGFEFDLGDVIADNASGAGFVIGNPVRADFELGNLGMVLSVNGRPVETGSSAAILGHPVRSLVAAARMAAKLGEPLEAGDIVLAGAATAAVPISHGQAISLQVQSLGSVAVTVAK